MEKQLSRQAFQKFIAVRDASITILMKNNKTKILDYYVRLKDT